MDPYRLDNLDKGWKGAETEVAGEDFEDDDYSDIVVDTQPVAVEVHSLAATQESQEFIDQPQVHDHPVGQPAGQGAVVCCSVLLHCVRSRVKHVCLG